VPAPAAVGAVSPSPSVAFKQLYLPVVQGGIGIINACQTSPAAFIGSCAEALPDVFNLFGDDRLSSPFSQRLQAACLRFCALHPQLDRTINDAESAEHLWYKFEIGKLSDHLQRKLTRLLHSAIVSEVLADAPAADRARLIGASCKHAGAWLSFTGPRLGVSMRNRDFSFALRHRLGLLPAQYLMGCVCNPLAFVSDHSHLHSCSRVKQGWMLRHRMICQAVAAIARDAGYSVQLEPPLFTQPGERADDERHTRADVELIQCDSDGARTVYLDVSVVHPAAPSYLRDVGDKLRVLSKQVSVRETNKIAKFNVAARRLSASFTPFVMESYGGIAPAAVSLIERLAFDAVGISTHGTDFTNWAYLRLSAALQAGNAEVSVKGLSVVPKPISM
jgi:hypothetical protein